jgi:hypothetical protein
MPAAGFYPIHTKQLSFRADGRWYADGEPVVHERLALLFSRYLRRRPQGGGYEIWIDERYHADVEVEDTPFVVTATEMLPDGSVDIHLNDGSTERLDPSTLRVGNGGVLYCAVKAGAEQARFLRAAYYDLAQYIEEGPPGHFQLRCGEQVFRIA